MAAPFMNAIAERFAAYGVGSIFIYTYEAHPGENYPHLMSMEQKFRHAHAMKDVFDVRHPILIDALDGACHRAYGSMPNMTWIFTRFGMPIYKSAWTDWRSIADTVAYFLVAAERAKAGENLIPFQVEYLGYRSRDEEVFCRELARNGPKATKEWKTYRRMRKS